MACALPTKMVLLTVFCSWGIVISWFSAKEAGYVSEAAELLLGKTVFSLTSRMFKRTCALQVTQIIDVHPVPIDVLHLRRVAVCHQLVE